MRKMFRILVIMVCLIMFTAICSAAPKNKEKSLRFNGRAYTGFIAAGKSVTLTLRVAGSPSCTTTSSGKAECQVMLYSGGRPNPGVSMATFRREYALEIDEVDVTMTLQTPGGKVMARSKKFDAGATAGYQHVIEASKLPPGEYRVVVQSAGKGGRFSVLWSEPIGD
jgi:hypothetical protein